MPPGRLILRAYASTDPLGATLGTLTDAAEINVVAEDNGLGGGSFSMSALSDQAAWLGVGAFVIAWRDTVTTRADAVGAFWVADATDVLLSEEEEGGRRIHRGGAGALGILSEAVVWHRAISGSRSNVQPRRRRWHWRNSHPGAVLMRMLEEAKRRRTIPDVTWDFSRRRDSDGNLWSKSNAQRINIPIGVNYLELCDILRDADLHISMTPDLKVHAWDDYDRDLSGSVEFTAGTDIRGEVVREIRGRRARSVVLVEGENKKGRTRHRVVRLKAIRSVLGRRMEGFYRYERTATWKVLRRVGRKRLRKWKRSWDGPFSLSVLDTPGQTALVDYVPGDTVAVHIPGSAYVHEAVRISRITLTEHDDGTYDPVLEFGDFLPYD